MNISGSSVDSSEGALIKSLFTNYDKDVKPTTSANGIVDIEFKFYLTRIESLVSIASSPDLYEMYLRNVIATINDICRSK